VSKATEPSRDAQTVSQWPLVSVSIINASLGLT